MHDRAASSLAGTDRTVLAINSLLRQQWGPLASEQHCLKFGYFTDHSIKTDQTTCPANTTTGSITKVDTFYV